VGACAGSADKPSLRLGSWPQGESPRLCQNEASKAGRPIRLLYRQAGSEPPQARAQVRAQAWVQVRAQAWVQVRARTLIFESAPALKPALVLAWPSGGALTLAQEQVRVQAQALALLARVLVSRLAQARDSSPASARAQVQGRARWRLV